MRFAFVEAFNETYPSLKEKLYYAVEVPTRDLYKFNDGAAKAGVGQRGNIDLVIYDEKGPRILIEFKGNNPSKKSYQKDFCKLDNEKEYKWPNFTALRYFIEILKSADGGTKDNLSDKCKDHPGIHFKFLDLNSGNYLTDIKL